MGYIGVINDFYDKYEGIMGYKVKNHSVIDELAKMQGTADDMLLLLGVSKNELSRMVEAGTIKKDAVGSYDLMYSVKGYIGYLQVRAGGLKSGTADYQDERARLTKAQADKGEMEAALMAGRLIDVDQLRSEWETMLMSMKAKLVAIPSKIAPLVADEDNPSVIQDMVDDYMREALEELALYGTRTVENDSVAGDESVDAPAEIDSKPVGRQRKKA